MKKISLLLALLVLPSLGTVQAMESKLKVEHPIPIGADTLVVGCTPKYHHKHFFTLDEGGKETVFGKTIFLAAGDYESTSFKDSKHEVDLPHLVGDMGQLSSLPGEIKVSRIIVELLTDHNLDGVDVEKQLKIFHGVLKDDGVVYWEIDGAKDSLLKKITEAAAKTGFTHVKTHLTNVPKQWKAQKAKLAMKWISQGRPLENIPIRDKDEFIVELKKSKL